jgi:geranylgeranyl diphosphate/geranylgeranyl-bacteriochlorophyllide a reductase
LSTEFYDCVIVGAGAAGCAAAMSLPRGTRALMVDRAAAGAGRCCGGLLAPDGQAALAALGLRLPDDVRVRPEPQTVHVTDLDSGRNQTYRRNYINLDRAGFDAWLLNEACKHAEFRGATRLVGFRAGDGPQPPGEVTIRLASARGEETVRTRLLVGADGAGSAVRRAAFPDRPAPPLMLAIQVVLASPDPPAVHEVLFASRLTDYYAWAIPKPGAVLVGAAFSEVRGAREKFEEILAWFRNLRGLGGEIVERSARRLTRPRRRSDLMPGAGPVILAGEAAGLVSPSSGEGLSFALMSGQAAGRAAGDASPATTYTHFFYHGPARRIAMKFIKARVIFSPAMRRWALRLPWCP